MKEKIAKLIDVKSIATLCMVGVFCYLSVAGQALSQEFITIFTVVISFYFGTQATKKNDNGGA